MMFGHSLYARDRSRTLMTAFNRANVCAGYQTIRRSRQLLMDYTIMCSEEGNVPIPSNINKRDFTMGGADNSNYRDRSSISGTDGLNYSSSCLFQLKVHPALRKPHLSETGLGRRDGPSEKVLPCQVVPSYNKPTVRPSLPDDMALYPENRQVEQLDMDGARTLSKKREFAISLLRLGLSPQDPLIWQGVHTLVSSAIVPLQRVGFLPVVPQPITERATVRHILTNFQNVRRQLNQDVIPVWADEAVYDHFREICLNEPDTFKDILPLMGSFHMSRILLKCQGKYLRGSGPDDALIECSVFGPGVLETVLNGTHFVRSLTGTLMVEDVVITLIWEEFWKHHDRNKYPALQQATDVVNKLSFQRAVS